MVDTNKEVEEMDAVAEAVEETAAATDSIPPTPESDDQGLNLNDIRACVTIIDIVTKRGAFEGPEMADVGSVRNRLDNFLKAAAEAQKPAEGEGEAETTA